MYYPPKLESYPSTPWKNIVGPVGEYQFVKHLLMNNYSIGMHDHDDYYELNFIINGKGVHYYGGNVYEVSVGDFFVIPPGDFHGYYSFGDLSVYHIIIKREFFDKYRNDLSILPGYASLFSIGPQLRKNTKMSGFLHLEGNDYKTIFDSVERTAILAILADISVNESVIVHAETIALIAQLTQIYTKSRSERKKYGTASYEGILTSALEIIHTEYGDKISAESIAERVGVSKSTLYRIFTENLAENPKEYLVHYRIEAAKKLLISTNKKVVDIANECGFFDSSHLIRTMVSLDGISPNQYRKKYAKEI